MAGKIVSLILCGLFLALALFIFARKKSPALMAIAGTEILLLALMQLLTWFVDPDFYFGVIVVSIFITASSFAAISVYQSDFRNFFLRLSRYHKKNADFSVTDEEMRESVNAIVTACQTMAKSRTGALIVIVKNKIDQYILDSGIKLDALISAPLLESIFNTRCPMHDGAVIIKGNKILTAGSFLPLSKNESIAKDLGTRHRAGIGVTEAEGSEIISIIISEENGIISTAANGVLRRYLTPERLFDLLYDPYRSNGEERKTRKSRNFLHK
ncbi:MAG: diadenylate cyclase [Christensenellales bacterium]